MIDTSLNVDQGTKVQDDMDLDTDREAEQSRNGTDGL